MEVTVKVNSISQILKAHGLDKSGHIQMFHTQNVLRRIQRYMPYRTGATIKLMIVQTNIRKPEIVLNTPYAKYLFYGKVMIDPVTGVAGFPTKYGWKSRAGSKKVLTARDINFDKTKNPLAGPRWDLRLSAAEGQIMARELQRYIDMRG